MKRNGHFDFEHGVFAGHYGHALAVVMRAEQGVRVTDGRHLRGEHGGLAQGQLQM